MAWWGVVGRRVWWWLVGRPGVRRCRGVGQAHMRGLGAPESERRRVALWERTHQSAGRCRDAPIDKHELAGSVEGLHRLLLAPENPDSTSRVRRDRRINRHRSVAQSWHPRALRRVNAALRAFACSPIHNSEKHKRGGSCNGLRRREATFMSGEPGQDAARRDSGPDALQEHEAPLMAECSRG